MAERKITERIWTGATGKQILAMGRDHMLVALYLITCSKSDWSGLYNIELKDIVIDLCFWSMDKPQDVKGFAIVEGIMKDLQAIDFCLFDARSGLVYIPQMMAYQLGRKLTASDNRVKSVCRHAEKIGRHDFTIRMIKEYLEPISKPVVGESLEIEELVRGLQGPSKALLSPSQGADNEYDIDIDLFNRGYGGAKPKPEPKPKRPKINFNFDSRQWENVTQKDLDGWHLGYPAVDIRLSLIQMANWLVSNPSKSKSNYSQFINNWLRGDQQKGGGPAKRTMHAKAPSPETIHGEVKTGGLLSNNSRDWENEF